MEAKFLIAMSIVALLACLLAKLIFWYVRKVQTNKKRL
jgi:high-affinity Fe2+/Pb2+ permease